MTELPPGVPAQIGSYVVEGVLGEGGQGLVLAARHPQGGRTAIKLLLDDDLEAAKRFRQEARLLAALRSALETLSGGC